MKPKEYITKQIPTMVGSENVSSMKLTTLISLLNGYAQHYTEEEVLVDLPLPADIEIEAKMVLRSMHIKKGYDKDFTDDDILHGLRLMCVNYRKYLLKTV